MSLLVSYEKYTHTTSKALFVVNLVRSIIFIIQTNKFFLEKRIKLKKLKCQAKSLQIFCNFLHESCRVRIKLNCS